jgi:hypothetical protein
VTVTSIMSPGARAARNDAALDAIRHHHEALSRDLAGRVDQVLAAVRAGVSGAPGAGLDVETSEARDHLSTFLSDELFPHATAEEHTLYPAAARDEHTRSLVGAMIDEHRTLTQQAAALRAAVDPVTLVALAAGLRAVFEVHVSKENNHVLTALMYEGADLHALLHDSHHLVAPAGDGAH